tara:strand:- start:243 stop:1553 length:1311 start_codon:yes stop_codon:yes gene_type:complete
MSAMFFFKIGKNVYKGTGNIQLKAIKNAGYKVLTNVSDAVKQKALAFNKIPKTIMAALRETAKVESPVTKFKPVRFGKFKGKIIDVPAAKFKAKLVGKGPNAKLVREEIIEVAGKKLDTKKISPAKLEEKLKEAGKIKTDKKKPVEKKKVEDKKKTTTTKKTTDKKEVKKPTNVRGGSKKVEDKKKTTTTTKKKEVKKPTTTRGGSGKQTQKKPVTTTTKKKEVKKPTTVRGGSKKVKQMTASQMLKQTKSTKLTPPPKSLTANQTDRLVNQVSSKTNVAKGTIRSFISRNAGRLSLASLPLVGMAAVVIGELMSPSKIAVSTLNGKKSGVPLGPNRPKTKVKQKDSKTKVTQPKSPLSKSKVTAPVKKSKTRPEALKKIKAAVQKATSGKKFNLIGGGTGTATQRLAEIDAEKKLEKRLKRRPTKAELKKYLQSN